MSKKALTQYHSTRHSACLGRKEKPVRKRISIIKRSLRTLGAISLLIGLTSGEALAGVWTHTASACAVDEGSAAKYEVIAARFRFKSGQTGTITARCMSRTQWMP